MDCTWSKLKLDAITTTFTLQERHWEKSICDHPNSVISQSCRKAAAPFAAFVCGCALRVRPCVHSDPSRAVVGGGQSNVLSRAVTAFVLRYHATTSLSHELVVLRLSTILCSSFALYHDIARRLECKREILTGSLHTCKSACEC